MGSRQKRESSDMICEECGNIFVISRIVSSKRERYHIKDIYCPKCGKITKHIELGDASYVKKALEFNRYLTPEEQYIYDLLCMKDKNKDNKDTKQI